MNKLKYVIRHEFRLTAANKAFVLLTIFGPFLIFAVTVMPSLITQSPGTVASGKPLAVYGAPEPVEQALMQAFSAMNIEVRKVDNVAKAKTGVLNGTWIALLVIDQGWPDSGAAQWYSKSGVEVALYGAAKATLDAAAREARIAASGIDPALIQKVLASPSFEVIKLEGSGMEQTKSEAAFFELLMTVLVFIMLIYMTVLLYGQMIGRSVVTEKTSKTVEIMLSSVNARDLMFGKIFGQGVAGLLQYAVWISMAMLLKQFVGPLLGLAIPAGLSTANLGWLLVFFVLAFFLYASAYAALGAASEDEQHLGQMAWPLIIFLIVPMVMLSTLVTNPDSTIVVVLSLFPLTSPIVMLARILVGSPPVWQIALCLGILVLSVGAMALFAAKIFRVGILLTGKRAKLGEVLRWVRVK